MHHFQTSIPTRTSLAIAHSCIDQCIDFVFPKRMALVVIKFRGYRSFTTLRSLLNTFSPVYWEDTRTYTEYTNTVALVSP